jgi:iron complex outermembrane recepter protein
MNHRSLIARLLTAFGACAAATHPGTSCAQTAATLSPASATAAPVVAGDSGQLSEVVVTAEKRSESVQKIPATITSVSEQALSDASITNLQQLSSLVSGYQGPGDNALAPPHIRGVGSQLSTVGNENAVSYYVDGFYLSSLNRALLGLDDAQQVDVLKGPQGTLFGRNATGGAILVTTREPGDSLNADVNVGFANYQTESSSAYVGGPLTDNIGADVSTHVSHQGQGWGTNLYDGADVYRTILDFSTRSKWVFRFDDATKLTVTGDYGAVNDDGVGAGSLVPGELTSFGRFPTGTGWDVNVDQVPYTQSRTAGITARLDHDFDFARLSNLSSYRESSYSYRYTDFDATPFPGGRVVNSPFDSEVTEELQLVSTSGQRFAWTTGVYYYHGYDRSSINLELLPGFQPLFPFQQESIIGFQRTDSGSIYGQGTYNLTSSTRLTLGGRYTVERRSMEDAQNFLLPNGVPASGTELGMPPISTSTDYHPVTWRVALDQDLSKDILAYASASRGFKSGGYNLTTPSNPVFQPETITAYEVGLKSQIFDQRLRLNAAAFYYDYKNIQIDEFEGDTTLIANGAAARIYGLDFDAVGKITNRFTLTSSIEVLNPKFSSYPNALFYTPSPVGGNTSTVESANGKYLPLSSKFTGSLLATYAIPSAIGEWRTTASYAYNSGYYFAPDNTLRQPSFSVLGATALYTVPNGHFTIQLWGANLTNRRVANEMEESTFANEVTYNAPRTYGITFGYHL